MGWCERTVASIPTHLGCSSWHDWHLSLKVQLKSVPMGCVGVGQSVSLLG